MRKHFSSITYVDPGSIKSIDFVFAHEVQNTVYLGAIVQAPSMGSYHESNWYGSHFAIDENSGLVLVL